MIQFPHFHVLDHPLIQHKLSHLRDRNCKTARFRQLMREIALLMGYEVTRCLPTLPINIETPLTSIQALQVDVNNITIVPILRAGLVMAQGLSELIPTASHGHLGLYRDPTTHHPVEYLVKLPPVREKAIFILVDPMIATGHSASYAVDILNKHGVQDAHILFLALVVAPEGIKQFYQHHPQVKIYTAALDSHLNDHGYIIPGLGDAGDRLFGTE